ncbi:MAG TPA: xanthine dehydrogenase small subunit [Anaeromyxobacter sp.]|nr:xanthine dehydrogenase small subunit [Anaeromyxobacter sp.]
MRRAVRFILDGRERSVSDLDPTTTVLQWLRGSEGRFGTKEGCAEGDCGACTVVLGELRSGEVRLRAVNACLLLLPALDGKALFTVESLARKGVLHPVQRALVECHGSQCGFCTPGFVMSIFAFYESEREAPTRRRIDEVLSGNLCRCTGYRPIVEAVRAAYLLGRREGEDARGALAKALRGLSGEEELDLSYGGKRYLAPRSLDALASFLEDHPGAHVVAGATDLGLLLTKEHRDLELVVSVGSVPELCAIRETESHLEIGAAVTYTDALEPLAALEPTLGELVRRIGSTQIRNVATVCGNLANASPVGDMAPALLALEASVVLRRGKRRRELPLSSFFQGYRRTAREPGELLEQVRIPRAAAHRLFRVYKVSKRFDQDISSVCGAFAVEVDGGRIRAARVAFGGMAAVPLRALSAEAALVGRPLGEGAALAAAAALTAELSPLSDMRASAGYRRLVAGNLLRRFVHEAAGSPGQSRVLAEGSA